MMSVEKSRKKEQVWEKAIAHYSICFIVGFFIGVAPTSDPLIFSKQDLTLTKQSFNNIAQSALPIPLVNRSLNAEAPADGVVLKDRIKLPKLVPRKLLIIVTVLRTSNGNMEGVVLTRPGNTLRLVPPPLLWIVVEAQQQWQQVYDDQLSRILRKTGIMYRNLVVKENFITESEADFTDHRMNVALRHIKNHQLRGIVHSASAWAVYDLRFFEELRETEYEPDLSLFSNYWSENSMAGVVNDITECRRMFGRWPVSTDKKGEVYNPSKIMGWHVQFRQHSCETETANASVVHRHSCFALNSSILLDQFSVWSSAPVTAQV